MNNTWSMYVHDRVIDACNELSTCDSVCVCVGGGGVVCIRDIYGSVHL